MATFKTHYDNLQVSRLASEEVVRSAYRSLAQKHHPDKNPEDRKNSERIMKILNEAYEVLSNPEKRRKHDEWIREQEREPSPQRPSQQPHSGSYQQPSQQPNPGSYRQPPQRPNPESYYQPPTQPLSNGSAGKWLLGISILIGVIWVIPGEVIVWQLLILSGISIASVLFGRTGLKLSFLGAAIWTLVMCFVSWLMILQLVTVISGLFFGNFVLKSVDTKKIRSAVWSFFVQSFVGLFIIGIVWAILAKNQPITPVSQPVTPSSAQTNINPQNDLSRRVAVVVQEMEARYPDLDPKSPHYNQALVNKALRLKENYEKQGSPTDEAIRRAVWKVEQRGATRPTTRSIVKRKSAFDMRKCLELKTNEQIAQCTNG